MNEGRPNIWFHICPLISNIPTFSCLLTSSHYLLPFSPSLSFSRIATVNKECAVFPQALKESLTLHSHNHFRPGCLGRHLHWDLPATRCRQNQTSEQRKSWKTKKKIKKSTVTVKQSQKEERDQSENMKHMSPGSTNSFSPPLVIGWFGAPVWKWQIWRGLLWLYPPINL